MTIRAATDKVIIVPDDADTIKESGLIVSYKKEPNPTSGIIYSVGTPGEYSMEGIEVGQRAYFNDMAGAEVTYEGTKYYILNYGEVLGVSDDTN